MEVKGNAGSTIAGVMSLAAFATAVVAGVAAGNGATTVIVRALVALVVCYPLGLIAGLVVSRAIDRASPESDERVEAHDDATEPEEEMLVV